MEYNRPLPRRSPARRRVRDAQNALDSAVRKAYGMKDAEDTLAFLLRLNLELAAEEAKGSPVMPPGLPKSYAKTQEFMTDDCLAASVPG